MALATSRDDALAHQALEAAAIAYVFKDADEEEPSSAVRMAGAGQGVIAYEFVLAVVNQPEPEPRLSQRERDVLRHVAQGMTIPQIATRLFINVSTGGFHIHNTLTKLDAKKPKRSSRHRLTRGTHRPRTT